MQTIAEFHVLTERFALHRTLADTDVSFEAERITAHESDRVIPLLWAVGEQSDLDRLEGVRQEDPSVEGVTLVTGLEDESTRPGLGRRYGKSRERCPGGHSRRPGVVGVERRYWGSQSISIVTVS